METRTVSKPRPAEKIIFVLSIASLIFWVSYWLMIDDIYKIAFIGAVYELLSIPMLASIIILPVFSFIQWLKKRFRIDILPFYSLIMNMIVIAIAAWRMLQD